MISLEMGKIRTEGEGEVQEFVDMVSGVFYDVRSDLSEQFRRIMA